MRKILRKIGAFVLSISFILWPAFSFAQVPVTPSGNINIPIVPEIVSVTNDKPTDNSVFLQINFNTLGIVIPSSVISTFLKSGSPIPGIYTPPGVTSIPGGIIVPGVVISGSVIPSVEIVWAKVSGSSITDPKSSGVINYPFGTLPPPSSLTAYSTQNNVNIFAVGTSYTSPTTISYVYKIQDLAPDTTYNYQVKYKTTFGLSLHSYIHTFKTKVGNTALAPKITTGVFNTTMTAADIRIRIEAVNPASFPLALQLVYGKLGQSFGPTSGALNNTTIINPIDTAQPLSFSQFGSFAPKNKSLSTENLQPSDLPKNMIIPLTDLEPGTTYVYFVSKLGNSTQSGTQYTSQYSDTKYFTTLPNTIVTPPPATTTPTVTPSKNSLVTAVQTLVKKINNVIINPLIGLMFAVALAYFIWGVIEYLMNAESDDARSKGKQHMLWGIIGMFIMISVFGIMQLLLNTVHATLPGGITPRG